MLTVPSGGAPLIVGAGAIGLGIIADRLVRGGWDPRVLVRRSDPRLHAERLDAIQRGLTVIDPHGRQRRLAVEAIDGGDPAARRRAFLAASVIFVGVGATSVEAAAVEIATVTRSQGIPMVLCENLPPLSRARIDAALIRSGMPTGLATHAVSFDVASIADGPAPSVTVLHDAGPLISSRPPPLEAARLEALRVPYLFEMMDWFDVAVEGKFLLQLHIYDGINCLAAARGLDRVPASTDDALCLWRIVEQSSAAVAAALARDHPARAGFIARCRDDALTVAKRCAPLDSVARNLRNIERKLGEDERFLGPVRLLERADVACPEAYEILDAARRFANDRGSARAAINGRRSGHADP